MLLQNRPDPFPGRMAQKATFSLVSVGLGFFVLCIISVSIVSEINTEIKAITLKNKDAGSVQIRCSYKCIK